MLVRSPSDALCDEASRVGVLLVAEIPPDVEELRRLGRWPSVGMVVLPRGETQLAHAEDLRHNVVIAECLQSGKTATPSAEASAAIVELQRADESLSANAVASPAALIARRVDGSFSSVAEARAACDVLQRELAGTADWSGYIV